MSDETLFTISYLLNCVQAILLVVVVGLWRMDSIKRDARWFRPGMMIGTGSLKSIDLHLFSKGN